MSVSLSFQELIKRSFTNALTIFPQQHGAARAHTSAHNQRGYIGCVVVASAAAALMLWN